MNSESTAPPFSVIAAPAEGHAFVLNAVRFSVIIRSSAFERLPSFMSAASPTSARTSLSGRLTAFFTAFLGSFSLRLLMSVSAKEREIMLPGSTCLEMLRITGPEIPFRVMTASPSASFFPAFILTLTDVPSAFPSFLSRLRGARAGRNGVTVCPNALSMDIPLPS